MDSSEGGRSGVAVLCPGCGAGISTEWQYCPVCGESLGRAGRAVSARRWTDIALGVGILAALLLPQLHRSPQAPAAVTAPPSPGTVQVPADHWVDTGITLTAGERITLTAEGQWNPWEGQYADMGPEGIARTSHGDSMCQEANWGALVGRIGDGPFFPIGSHKVLTADRPGRLTIGINDDYDSRATQDNTGSLSVTVAGLPDTPDAPALIDLPAQS